MKLNYVQCKINDLDILMDISRTTFIGAFEKDNDPKDFENYIDSAFSKSNLEAQLLNPDSEFYFVYKDMSVVAYFKLNKKDAQTEIFGDLAVELERIYVLEAFQGQQVGKHILTRIIEMVTQWKASFLWLGVWENNTAAIRFYDRFGFKKFDTHPYYIGNDKQTDWLMRLNIT